MNEIGFDNALDLARQIFNNEKWDETLQEYALHLLETIRNIFPEKWNSNWKYDAFLGYAYDILLEYEKRYTAFKRAFDKVSPTPPQLLVAMAGCCWAPGAAPITEEKAIELVKQAIAKIQYVEAVELLKGLYKSIGNTTECQYWDKILESLKENGTHLSSLDQI